MLEKLIHQCRVSEVAGLNVRIIGAYNANNCGGDANLATFFSEMAPLSNDLRAVVKRARVESVLEGEDNLRDDDVRGINYLLIALSFHPDLAVRKAAKTVLKTFKRFGLSIIDQGYTSESGLINSLLDDFKLPKIQAAIAELPLLASYISALEASQSNFEQIRIAQEAELAEEDTLANATTLKKEIITIINHKIVEYLRIMVPLNEAVYGGFARTVSKMIEEQNEIVRKRSNKTNNDLPPEE